jgi:hypothetical protein
VSHPDGFAVTDHLKRDMALPAASGRDWADRKRPAARVPNLDPFPQGPVERERGGWKTRAAPFWLSWRRVLPPNGRWRPLQPNAKR